MTKNPFLFIVLVILTAGGTCEGFNYTEFFLEKNPYLAQEMVQNYTEFSRQINSALGLPENVQSSSGGSTAEGGGALQETKGGHDLPRNLKASVGVTSIFALLHENIWGRVKTPGFEGIQPHFRSRDALPEMLGTLFRAAEQDYNTKVRSIIFTPTWIKMGLHMANMKSEIKQALLQFPDKAQDQVNHMIRRRFSNSVNFPEFLTHPLPDTTQALIFSSKDQRGRWPSFTDYVGNSAFRSRSDHSTSGETVTMFEIRGKFKFWENQDFQFVTIPLRDTKLRVTLALSKDQNSGKELEFEEILRSENVTDENVIPLRVRLPIKSFIARNKIEVGDASVSCSKDNTISSPCLQMLDSLTYTSFSPTEFQFIVLTGAYINNPYLTHFKVNKSPLNNGTRSWKNPSDLPPLETWRWFHPSAQKERRSRSLWGSSWPWQFPLGRSPYKYSSYDFNSSNFANERILIFDQPFHWFVRGSI